MRELTQYLLVFTVTSTTKIATENQSGGEIHFEERTYPQTLYKIFPADSDEQARRTMLAILADHRSLGLKAKKPRLFPLLKNIVKTNRRKS